MDGELIVGQVLIADFDSQFSREALQMLEKERVGKLVFHGVLPARRERGSRNEDIEINAAENSAPHLIPTIANFRNLFKRILYC
jgi:hypothetical protein